MADSRAHSDRVDRWLSLAAGIGALCAVAIALYQASLARERLRVSAWPFLAQSNSFTGADHMRDVQNAGVGPARVRNFAVLVDGQPVSIWGAAVRALTNAPDSGLVYSSLGRGSVLPPGSTRTLLRLPPGPRCAAHQGRRANAARVFSRGLVIRRRTLRHGSLPSSARCPDGFGCAFAYAVSITGSRCCR